jgi:hypothetical protein
MPDGRRLLHPLFQAIGQQRRLEQFLLYNC